MKNGKCVKERAHEQLLKLKELYERTKIAARKHERSHRIDRIIRKRFT